MKRLQPTPGRPSNFLAFRFCRETRLILIQHGVDHQHLQSVDWPLMAADAFIGSVDAPPVIEHPRGEVDAVESAIILAFFLSLIDRQQIEDLPALLRSKPDRYPCDYLFSIAPPERLAGRPTIFEELHSS